MANAASLAAFQYRKRQRNRRDFSAFDSNIASPFDLGSAPGPGGDFPNSFVMPANGRLAISFSGTVTSGDLIVDMGSNRTLTIPDLAADTLFPLGWLEKGKAVVVEDAGLTNGQTVSLYVLNPLNNNASLIATGTT